MRRCGFGGWAARCANANANAQRLVANFVDDVTIPDGMVLQSGASFDKVWRMINSGTVAWPEGTVLTFIGGEALGAPQQCAVPLAAPGQSVDIVVSMVAPESTGRHAGYWRLAAPGGRHFGQRVWVDISVAPRAEPKSEPVPEQPIEQPAPSAPEAEPEVEAPAPQLLISSIIPPSEDESVKLQQLTDMGFSDVALLLNVLRIHDGDLVETVRALLE